MWYFAGKESHCVVYAFLEVSSVSEDSVLFLDAGSGNTWSITQTGKRRFPSTSPGFSIGPATEAGQGTPSASQGVASLCYHWCSQTWNRKSLSSPSLDWNSKDLETMFTCEVFFTLGPAPPWNISSQHHFSSASYPHGRRLTEGFVWILQNMCGIRWTSCVQMTVVLWSLNIYVPDHVCKFVVFFWIRKLCRGEQLCISWAGDLLGRLRWQRTRVREGCLRRHPYHLHWGEHSAHFRPCVANSTGAWGVHANLRLWFGTERGKQQAFGLLFHRGLWLRGAHCKSGTF